MPTNCHRDQTPTLCILDINPHQQRNSAGLCQVDCNVCFCVFLACIVFPTLGRHHISSTDTHYGFLLCHYLGTEWNSCRHMTPEGLCGLVKCHQSLQRHNGGLKSKNRGNYAFK